ncbi:unnamed protein product [Candida verbasci]|uniref:RIC1 C-terminal alpha solenoid region domain-containing protein n=1 Tax=Candida verbasci TaxID=1227364 RepID=A0A9W4XM56_9ASCO|nr:unnamed protein product [Candida verbasci]
MVWINGCPQFSVDIPLKPQEILEILDITHTPLLAILTPTSIYIFNKYTLLPLANHARNLDSIENNGLNIDLKVKNVSVNTSKLQKLPTINLFIQTNLNFLIIYQLSINFSKNLYEIHNSNNELIQSGLPMTFTPSKFSITNFVKNATKSIIHGTEEISINLENVENVNNCSIDDEVNNFNIEYVKIGIFKILKIGIGYKEYWLQENSHNLFVFNNHDDKEEHQEKPDDDFIHMVNILTLKTQLFVFSEFEWYNSVRIKYITFNEFENYFIFVNTKNEIWYTSLESDGLIGYKIGKGNIKNMSFNPKYNLILINENDVLKIATIKNKSFQIIKNLDYNGEFKWSSCGSFFILIDDEKHWKLISKFGNVFSDTQEISNEVDEDLEQTYLKASSVVISGNSSVLYVLNESKLHYINLVKSTNNILYDKEYISLIEKNRNLIRFPITPKFKNIFQFQENHSGNSKTQHGRFSISQNIFDQLSISYGDHLAVSTPITTGGNINHILWFNFRNFLAESMNIINQFWFRDYLIIINRIPKHTDDEDEFIDEFIVFDTSLLKYGTGGEEITFNSDLLIWKYNFNSTFVVSTIIDTNKTKSKVVLLTSDHRLVVLNLSTNRILEQNNESKHYKIHLSVDKTVHLSSIVKKINLNEVIQISMIQDKHFLFLLSNGEFYLLKNQSPRRSSSFSKPIEVIKPSNIYDLIKLHSSIEYFQFKSIKFQDKLDFIYLFNGSQIFIYEINELINKSKPIQQEEIVDDLLEDIEDEPLLPIVIDCRNLQPFKFDVISNKSIDIIGVENIILNKSNGLIIKNRIRHQLILNNFIEFDLLHKGDLESSFNKYKHFENFHYCLELLLFKHLTIDEDKTQLTLKRLFQLIEFTENSEFIYINCLRKIEIVYWNKFFKILDTTPENFMSRLIEIDNVELCYNYLIVYLNYRKEEDEKKDFDQLNENDKKIILKIIKMLDKSKKWDWCFELCRFIKILEPSGQFLKQIEHELT